MHHLANSITKLCHGKKQDSTAWKDVRMYHCSREEAVFVIVGRGGGCLYARGLIRFDSLRFGIRYSDARIATMLYVTVFALCSGGRQLMFPSTAVTLLSQVDQLGSPTLNIFYHVYISTSVCRPYSGSVFQL